jgi:hypothetical protein
MHEDVIYVKVIVEKTIKQNDLAEEALDPVQKDERIVGNAPHLRTSLALVSACMYACM